MESGKVFKREIAHQERFLVPEDTSLVWERTISKKNTCVASLGMIGGGGW